MNSPCSTALLESALAGNLPADVESTLQRHLEECEACGAALERMAGGIAWCKEVASLLPEDELDPAAPVRDEWSAVDFTVEHLEPSDDPSLLGRLGGYDVLEIIGHGGMGVVLKGYDRELKRCVAIKVLAPHLALSSLARKRFAREAQAAAAVVHPNVLAIHQVQPSGRLPFLVMPLVAGESLAERLTAQGTLELKEILRIGIQAAAGLAAAHEQGLVHRDVKPANILLEKGVERAVLTDFGLARAADDVALTRWGIIAGTPQYMSPEQARGEPLDGRSDLFSLGTVLYEMATGVSPFRTDSIMATLRRLVDVAPQALASLNPELPPWFIAIVDRLLEKDPSRRFSSAREVSELLEGCLAHVQQPAAVPLPASLVPRSQGGHVSSISRRSLGVVVMIATLALGWVAMFAWQGESPQAVSDDSLEGVWELALPPEIDANRPDDQRLRLVFAGDWYATYRGTQRVSASRLKVEPQHSPKRLSFVDAEANSMRGIYEIKNDGLRLSVAPETDALPTKFGTEHPEFTRVRGQVAQELLDALDRHAQAEETPPKSTETVPTRVHRFADLATGHSFKVACSADGKLIAFANGNPTIVLETSSTSRVADNWQPSLKVLDAETGETVVSLALTAAAEDAVLAATERVSHVEATALAFSPDGNLVAVGTSIGQVKLFNARTGELVRSLDDEGAKLADKETPENWKSLRRAMGSVASLEFSPDGGQLATCGGSFADFAEGFSSVERLGLRVTGPGRLKLWDVQTGTLKHDLAGHNDQAYAVCFSPDGRFLASAGRWHDKGDMFGNGIILWNAQTGEQIHRLIRTTASAGTRAIAFSPDSKMLAMGTQRFGDDDSQPSTGGVSLVHVSSGIEEWLVTVPGWAKPLAFSPDGKNVAVLCGGRSIRFLAIGTGTMTHEIRPADALKNVMWDDFAVAPQGDMLAIGDVDKEQNGSVEVWSTRIGDNANQPAATSQRQTKSDMPQRIHLVHRFPTDARVKTIAYSPDGRLIAVANGNPTFPLTAVSKRSVEILDAETGETVASLKLTTDEEDAVLAATEGLPHFEVEALAFSPVGWVLAVGTGMGQVKLFSAPTGEFIRSMDDEHAKLAERTTPENLKSLSRAMGSVASMAISPDGSLLATCGGSFDDFARNWGGVRRLGRLATGPGRLKVWDVNTGTLKHDLVGHSHVNAISFSPDGNLLASAGRWDDESESGTGVIVWNPHTGERIRTIANEANGGTHAVTFSPNSKLVAIGSRVFDKDDDTSTTNVSLAHAGTGIVEWTQTIPGWANPKGFSPDGKSVAVLCSGESLRFFDTETGTVQHEIKAADSHHGGGWTGFAIAPKRESVAIGGERGEGKGSVEFWDFDGNGAAAMSQLPRRFVAAAPVIHSFQTRESVKIVAFSADGELIAIANAPPFKRSVEILDAATGATAVTIKLSTDEEDAVLAATEQAPHFEIEALAFSPDGNMVAVGTGIGQVKLFDARTGELVRSLDDEQAKLAERSTPATLKALSRAMGSVKSLAFSPDGNLLAVCGRSFDDVARDWGGVESSGRSATGPGRLKVWDVETGTLKQDLVGHSHVEAVSCSPDGNLLGSAGRWADGSDSGTGVILWNLHTGARFRTIPDRANGGTQAIAFSHDSELVMISSRSLGKGDDGDTSAVSVTHVASGILEWQQTVPFTSAKPVAFLPDGQSVAVLSRAESCIRFFDTATGRVKYEIRSADDSSQLVRWTDFAIAPQSHMLAVVGVDQLQGNGLVRVWELETPDAAATQIGVQGKKPQEDAEDVSKLLEGCWRLVDLEVDGKNAPLEALEGGRWTFKGLELQCADPGERPGIWSAITLDSSKTPKHIDLVVPEGPQKGQTVQGIFKFEDERLVVCLRSLEAAGKGRPKEFMTGADSGLGMTTLERLKE